MFLDYFNKKIDNIIRSFENDHISVSILETPDPDPVIKLPCFCCVNKDAVKAIVHKAKLTCCDNDPLPICDIKGSVNFGDYLDILTELANTSIHCNAFPEMDKVAIVRPTINRKLHPQYLSSFKLVSNLTYPSKILQNVILNQLMGHLELVQALPDQQSVYKRL